MSVPKIGGLGLVIVDELMVVPVHPESNTKNRARQRLRQVGGPVPTALVALTRLGCRTTFIGAWADDDGGRFIERDLACEGVGTAGARRVADGRSALAHIWVASDTRHRTIVNHPGELGPLTLSQAARAELADCDVLHLDGRDVEAAIDAIDIVRRRGGRIVLDAGLKKPRLPELMALADVVVQPLEGARQLCGAVDSDQAAATLRRPGQVLVVTDGVNGAACHTDDQSYHQPAFTVEVVDTTGAGDCFCAGFIYGMLHTWPWADVLRFASAVAAMKCTCLGTRQALADPAGVHAFLRAQGAAAWDQRGNADDHRGDGLAR